MHLTYDNVNDAFLGIVSGIHSGRIPTNEQPSRNGAVLVIEEPVIITYRNPTDRVLFNENRNCNPFFHLYESLWMLAGRNDVDSVAYYASNIRNYSDDGKALNGAYGFRWRRHLPNWYPPLYVENTGMSLPSFDLRSPGHSVVEGYDNIDQLKVLIGHLKANPYSRRAVLQMWNVENDLLKIDSSKDVCCNLSALFSVETGLCPECSGEGMIEGHWTYGTEQMRHEPCPRCNGTPHDQPRYLNMTVTNRSNDLIWGTLGANVVHFSVLQEYVARHLGLEVGSYHQFSTNQHVYKSNWKPEKWLAGYVHPSRRTMHDPPLISYSKDVNRRVPLIDNSEVFDKELPGLVKWFSGAALPISSSRPIPPEEYVSGHLGREIGHVNISEPFFVEVAAPMLLAFYYHKARCYGLAIDAMKEVKADDWRIAGLAWIKRRQRNWERKEV